MDGGAMLRAHEGRCPKPPLLLDGRSGQHLPDRKKDLLKKEVGVIRIIREIGKDQKGE
jgi:hypothetical protein